MPSDGQDMRRGIAIVTPGSGTRSSWSAPGPMRLSRPGSAEAAPEMEASGQRFRPAGGAFRAPVPMALDATALRVEVDDGGTSAEELSPTESLGGSSDSDAFESACDMEDELPVARPPLGLLDSPQLGRIRRGRSPARTATPRRTTPRLADLQAHRSSPQAPRDVATMYRTPPLRPTTTPRAPARRPQVPRQRYRFGLEGELDLRERLDRPQQSREAAAMRSMRRAQREAQLLCGAGDAFRTPSHARPVRQKRVRGDHADDDSSYWLHMEPPRLRVVRPQRHVAALPEMPALGQRLTETAFMRIRRPIEDDEDSDPSGVWEAGLPVPPMALVESDMDWSDNGETGFRPLA